VGVAVDVGIIADDLTQRVDAFSKGAVDRQGIVKFRVGAAAIEKAVLAGIEAVAVVIPDDLPASLIPVAAVEEGNAEGSTISV